MCCLSSATAGLIMTLGLSSARRPHRHPIHVRGHGTGAYAGCTPVFVDVANDGNADLDDLARVLRTTPNVARSSGA
jgi:hypothetical protein